MDKRKITVEEAISLLPEEGDIHTFYQMGNSIVGADWEREEVIRLLRERDTIEISGECARSLDHGIAAYNSDAKWQSEITFIQTDEKKLNAFDPVEEVTND